MMKHILVLNMGMKSIRSIIFSADGEKLAYAARPLKTYLDADYVLQSPEEWWEKARTVIRESLVDVGKENIGYITVTTSSSCLVYVDAQGRALAKCIMVSDKRGEAEKADLAANPVFQRMEPRESMGPGAYPMLLKMLWLQKHEPEMFAKVYKFLSPNDFLLAKMTGRYVTDGLDASKSHYDATAGSYPAELFASLGFRMETFPEVLPIGSNLGPLTEEAADYLDLSPDTQAVLTTYDAICSFFGSGVSQEGEASDVSGTVTVFRALSQKQDLQPNREIFIMPYPEMGMHIVGGSNNLGGGLIEWVKQCYYQNETYPYEVMEKDASEARLGADGVIFLPYLLGERAPIWNPDARGVFFGLERMHTRKEMTRAVFESTGFIDLDMIRAIEKTGMTVHTIRLSGGLARLNLISQIKADITGRDIEVLSEFETTSTGAAMLALTGVGRFRDLHEAAACFATVRMIIKPNAANHRKYLQMYQLYRDTYSSLKGMFRERMDIVRSLNHKHEVRIENL